MGPGEKADQEVRCSRDDIECVILRVRGRGIDVDSLTLGEILYIEQEAFNRDRTYWACSAQNAALLPPQPPSPGKGVANLTAAVNKYRGKT